MAATFGCYHQSQEHNATSEFLSFDPSYYPTASTSLCPQRAQILAGTPFSPCFIPHSGHPYMFIGHRFYDETSTVLPTSLREMRCYMDCECGEVAPPRSCSSLFILLTCRVSTWGRRFTRHHLAQASRYPFLPSVKKTVRTGPVFRSPFTVCHSHRPCHAVLLFAVSD